MLLGEGETHRLILGDCREWLPRLPREWAVVTDPPYGVDHDCDYTRFTGNLARQGTFKPVSGDAAPFDPTSLLGFSLVAMFGFNCFSDRLPSGSLLVWNKRREAKRGTLMADCEVVWLSKGHGVYLLDHEWDGFLRQSERSEKRVHPTQKPVAVMRWVLERLGVPEGAVVIDPYMGSGTTGVACLQTGRRFVGIEIDPAYFAIAQKRLDEAANACPLFEPVPVQGRLFDNGEDQP